MNRENFIILRSFTNRRNWASQLRGIFEACSVSSLQINLLQRAFNHILPTTVSSQNDLCTSWMIRYIFIARVHTFEEIKCDLLWLISAHWNRDRCLHKYPLLVGECTSPPLQRRVTMRICIFITALTFAVTSAQRRSWGKFPKNYYFGHYINS